MRKGREALFNYDVHPRQPAEHVFSSCVQTRCNTEQAPCRWHTSDQAPASSGGRREYRGSWPPWMEPQAPGPGPCRRTKHKNVFTGLKLLDVDNLRVVSWTIEIMTSVTALSFAPLTPTSRQTMTCQNVLGSGFLDPVLAFNSSTERDLDDLSSKTNMLSTIYSG